MLKVPSFAVVTVPIGISVDAPAFVVVFTEYNWMVAPEMGDCPPCTTPETCAVVVVAVFAGPFQLLSEHPERKTHRKQNKEAGTLRLDTVNTSKVNLRGPVEKTLRFL